MNSRYFSTLICVIITLVANPLSTVYEQRTWSQGHTPQLCALFPSVLATISTSHAGMPMTGIYKSCRFISPRLDIAYMQ